MTGPLGIGVTREEVGRVMCWGGGASEVGREGDEKGFLREVMLRSFLGVWVTVGVVLERNWFEFSPLSLSSLSLSLWEAVVGLIDSADGQRATGVLTRGVEMEETVRWRWFDGSASADEIRHSPQSSVSGADTMRVFPETVCEGVVVLNSSREFSSLERVSRSCIVCSVREYRVKTLSIEGRYLEYRAEQLYGTWEKVQTRRRERGRKEKRERETERQREKKARKWTKDLKTWLKNLKSFKMMNRKNVGEVEDSREQGEIDRK
jgi:hypothetical protein